MMKNCRKIILFYLCFALLVLSACVSEKNTEEDNRQLETIATQAANWLTTQVPECDVITTQAGKDGIILLTGVKNPGIATYAVLKAFVLEQDGGTFFIKETYDGEASISNGFTAYGFCTEDHSRGRYPCSTRAYRPQAAGGSCMGYRWRAGACSNMPDWW